MAEIKFLRWWMVAVGLLYTAMGVRLLPWINGPMIEAGLGDVAAPGVVLEPGTVIFDFVLDWMATFGLDLLVLGVVLLFAARAPLSHRILVHLVIWQEVVRGILADLWLAARPFANPAFYLGFALFHVAVIITGVWALRRARATEPTPALAR